MQRRTRRCRDWAVLPLTLSFCEAEERHCLRGLERLLQGIQDSEGCVSACATALSSGGLSGKDQSETFRNGSA